MAEAFKNLIDCDVAESLARHLGAVGAGFDRRRFEALALPGLERLELKARVHQLARALQASLPEDVDGALACLDASLAPIAPAPPAHTGTTSATWSTDIAGLSGWAVWPLTEAVTLIALDRPERALASLHAMTQRFSAEFALRPFIVRHPALCFDTLAHWVHDPSEQVRRLVSEGSRPRLPWGLRLQALVADPSPTLPLLEMLQDDPSETVRRSVANHLNDIAKDHPALIGEWLRRHLPGATPARRALLRHASRTLIKQGDSTALAAWGLGQPFCGTLRWTVSPNRLRVGEALRLQLSLHSTSPQPQRLAIDYAVHHVKANGATSAKVFKGWVVELAAHEGRLLERRHSFKPVTVRRYHAGRHAVDVRINGQVLAEAGFVLHV